MRGRAPACFCACVRACVSATLPLLLDTRRSSFRPQHEPPLFLSFSKCAAPPLVLNTHRSSLTRPSCRKPFLFCDRAVQRLAPVTCRSRASGARDRVADLAGAAGARRCVLQSVTCVLARACVRACVRVTRATLATSGDGPSQPGPADAAVATPLSSPPEPGGPPTFR